MSLHDNLVVNIHHRVPYDIYIGRPGPLGNPYSHLEGTLAEFKVGSREESLEAYMEYLYGQPELLAAVKAQLKGKVLGCFCRPKDGFGGKLLCHGQILAEVANEKAPAQASEMP